MGSDPQSYLAAMDEMAHRECAARIKALEEENGLLRRAVLNQCGDNLCHSDLKSLADLVGTNTKPPEKQEFLKSCERFIDQVISERGTLEPGCMTIAQLEAELVKQCDCTQKAEGALKVAAAHNLELQEENEALKMRNAGLAKIFDRILDEVKPERRMESNEPAAVRIRQVMDVNAEELGRTVLAEMKARIAELEKALQLFRKLYVNPHWDDNDPAIFIVRQGDRITVGDLRNGARLMEGSGM